MVDGLLGQDDEVLQVHCDHVHLPQLELLAPQRVTHRVLYREHPPLTAPVMDTVIKI